MNLPKNVFRFEILLYASLILDALSVAFDDRTATSGNSEQAIMAQSVFSACLIVADALPRLPCGTAPQELAALGADGGAGAVGDRADRIIGENGLALDSGIEIVSCVLTVAGLYFSFTGDAQGWFNA